MAEPEGVELLVNVRNKKTLERPLSAQLAEVRDAIHLVTTQENERAQARRAAAERLAERAKNDEVLSDILLVLGLELALWPGSCALSTARTAWCPCACRS